jgi:hypothetical protein
MVQRENRTERVQINLSVKEKAIIEHAASKSKMSFSDYLRAGGLMMALLDGNVDALKHTAGVIALVVKDRMGRISDHAVK